MKRQRGCDCVKALPIMHEFIEMEADFARKSGKAFRVPWQVMNGDELFCKDLQRISLAFRTCHPIFRTTMVEAIGTQKPNS
jgi:hypothetical protein